MAPDDDAASDDDVTSDDDAMPDDDVTSDDDTTPGGEVDQDGDGYPLPDDCDDEDAGVHPGATEVPYDGIDQDCQGGDLVDVDGDGSPVPDDCDDEDAGVHPGATEVPYDGIDQDCQGGDLVDVDGDGSPVPDDCDDGDAQVHPGATEVPYDGVDQDCHGGDLVDVDGDGSPVPDDCDDGDALRHPGATEVPYDAVDQDCDGADLCDVDGDGFDGDGCGGDDCEDTSASAWPGAPEVLENGFDDDCDGWSDEVDACPDGSGHFLTGQEAIDAAPEGGTVVLCPGTWTEPLVVQDRVLTIRGGGDMPEDTVLDATAGGPAVSFRGSGTDAVLEWVAVTGDDIYDSFIQMEDSSTVLAQKIDATTGGAHLFGNFYVFQGDGGGSLHLKYIRARGEIGVWSGFTMLESLTIEGCVLQGDISIYLMYGVTATLRNCIISDGTFWFHNHLMGGWGLDDYTGAAIENVTFARLSSVEFETWVESESYTWLSRVGQVRNSIFFDSQSTRLFETILWGWNDFFCSWVDQDAMIHDLQSNVHHGLDFGDHPGQYECSDERPADDGYCCYHEVDPTAYDDVFASGFTEADPLFAWSAERGSFDLDPASPCIDTGTGAADPDGSPPDIGAFGGPGGDWYLEFPWPLE